MQKLIKFLDMLEERLLVTSLIFTVGLIFLQVIMRYFFQSSLSWSEELARYIFVWQIWLGAALGVKYRKHIRVELIKGHIPKRMQRHFEVFVLLVWFAMTLYLAINGTALVEQLFSRRQLSPALRIPLGYAYASVPVGCGLMSLRLIQALYEEFVAAKEGDI